MALLDDFLSLWKNDALSIATQAGTVRRELEALREQRDAIVAAPPTEEDALACVEAYVDERADEYPKCLAFSLNRLRTSPAKAYKPLSAGGLGYSIIGAVLPHGQTVHPPLPTVADIERAMCFFFGDEIKTAVAAELATYDWGAAGDSLADRATALATIDAEIAEKEALIESLREVSDRVSTELGQI